MLKKVLKYSIFSLSATITIVAVFFFWSTKSNWDREDYFKLKINDEVVGDLPKDEYSIITYNLGYLSGMTNNTSFPSEELITQNLHEVKKQLSYINPDIVAFQEIDYDSDRGYHIDQCDEISKDRFRYNSKAVNWDVRYVPFPYWPPSIHFGQVVSGQSVCSNYEIENLSRITLSRVETEPFWSDAYYLDRMAQVVKVNIGQNQLILINVHLEAWDKETRRKQQQEVLEIWSQYSFDYPTVLLGDFNSDPIMKEATIQEILSRPDIQVSNMPSDNYELTYPSDSPRDRLDYIFFNDKIELVESEVLYSFGSVSDHLPLKMTFRIL